MNKFERIRAALNLEETDRVPANLWYHMSGIDHDPKALAEALVFNNEKYDFDFIKLMPFGLYSVQDWGVKVRYYNTAGNPPEVEDYAIHTIKDWSRIEPLPVKCGTWGETLKLAQYVEKLAGGKTPFVQTIFSPLTTAQKLAGDRILMDMKEDPGLFKQALQAITDTTIDFVKANIEAGVSGFFFATRCANHGYMTEEDYKVFGEYFDLQVINAYKDKTFFNIVHIHGEHGMFSLIEKYPVSCINWHDRWTPPTLAEARKLSGKCFLGGLREVPYYSEDGEVIAPSILNSGSAAEIEKHVNEAIEQLNGRGLIIGPGCGADEFVPEENIHAIRRAADYKYSKKHAASFEFGISSADAIQM